jgi:hypothetical protein
MPTDFLFYWMTGPAGFGIIGFALAVPFVLWRLVLGKGFRPIGFGPLFLAYACTALGYFALIFVSAYADFSARVARGLLAEEQRWSILPGWTVYTLVLFLILLLPFLTLAAPYAALLLRLRILKWSSIIASALGLWVALGLLMWLITFIGNPQHEPDLLIVWLRELLPGIAFVVVPFLLGIYLAAPPSSRAGEAA